MEKITKLQSKFIPKRPKGVRSIKKSSQKLSDPSKNQENVNPNKLEFPQHPLQEPLVLPKNHQGASLQETELNQFDTEQSTSLLRRRSSRNQEHQFKSSACNIYFRRGTLNRRIYRKRGSKQISMGKAQTLNKKRKLVQPHRNGDNDLNHFGDPPKHECSTHSDEEKNPAAHQMKSSACEEAMKRRLKILKDLDCIKLKTENAKDMTNLTEIAANLLKEIAEPAKTKEEEQIQQEENEVHDQQNFYKNFEDIGSGSFGNVIRQLHIPTRKFYAYKELKVQDDEKRERMAKQEFKLLKVIQEANVPILLQIKDLKRPPNFFARMEYGFGTLSNFLKFCKRKRLMKRWTENDILTLYFQLWSQLQELRKLKIFHSDIKPQNIIISSEGFFIVSDYGVSILLKKLGRQELSIQGTYDYYMPELQKARDEKKWSCEYDPMEQDLFACKKIIKDIILLKNRSDPRNKLGTLEELLERANIKNEEDYRRFITRKSLPIYEKKKAAYHIYLLDQYYKGYGWKEKHEIICDLIEYCHFAEINKWLKKKLEEHEYSQSEEYIYLCYLKARAQAVQAKYQKALKYYRECEEALSKFSYQIDPKYTSRLYSDMGSAAVLNYDFALARKYIDKSFKLKLQNENPTIELARNYCNLATMEYDEGNREKAVKNCEEGLKLFESEKANLQFFSLKNRLGLSLEALGRYNQAYDIFQDLYRELCPVYGKTHTGISAVLSNIAMVLDNTGNSKDALSYNQKSLEIDDELFFKGNQKFAYSLINMAVCYAYVGELEEALGCASESVQIIEDSKNHDPYVFVWMITMAEICIGLKEYESAKNYLQRYLDSYDQMSTSQDKLFLQKCFINWDHYVHKRKGIELALEKYKKRLACLAQNPQGHPVEASIHQRFAIIKILNGNYKDGLDDLEKAHKIIEKNPLFFSDPEIDLHKFFKSKNGLEEALEKDLKAFCEEYYQKCKSSIIVAPELHL